MCDSDIQSFPSSSRFPFPVAKKLLDGFAHGLSRASLPTAEASRLVWSVLANVALVSNQESWPSYGQLVSEFASSLFTLSGQNALPAPAPFGLPSFWESFRGKPDLYFFTSRKGDEAPRGLALLAAAIQGSPVAAFSASQDELLPPTGPSAHSFCRTEPAASFLESVRDLHAAGFFVPSEVLRESLHALYVACRKEDWETSHELHGAMMEVAAPLFLQPCRFDQAVSLISGALDSSNQGDRHFAQELILCGAKTAPKTGTIGKKVGMALEAVVASARENLDPNYDRALAALAGFRGGALAANVVCLRA